MNKLLLAAVIVPLVAGSAVAQDVNMTPTTVSGDGWRLIRIVVPMIPGFPLKRRCHKS